MEEGAVGSSDPPRPSGAMGNGVDDFGPIDTPQTGRGRHGTGKQLLDPEEPGDRRKRAKDRMNSRRRRKRKQKREDKKKRLKVDREKKAFLRGSEKGCRKN